MMPCSMEVQEVQVVQVVQVMQVMQVMQVVHCDQQAVEEALPGLE